MKKLFHLLLPMLLLSALQAHAYQVTLRFDNPAAISSIVLGPEGSQESYTPAATVTINTSTEGYLTVTAAQGRALTSCHVTATHNEYDAFSGAYRDSYDMYLSAGYDGQTYTFTTADLDALRTRSATVTVNGDVSKVMLQFSNTALYANLQQGVNTVPFMPDESTFTISSAISGKYLCAVSLNGEPQTDASGRWTLSVADGDQIVIDADFPDQPCSVNFSFTDPATTAYLTEVRLNDVTVTDWASGISAKAGDCIAFRVDTQMFRLNSFTVNGVAASFTGSYSAVLRSDVTFGFDVAPYGMVTANVTVDTPGHILYRVGYSGDFLPVTASPFAVEISESVASYTPVYFKATDQAYITSVTAGGTALTQNYDGTYSTVITDGMQIAVATAAIVRDSRAVLYLHNPEDAQNYNIGLYGCSLASAYSSSIPVVKGYNQLSFGEIDVPYTFTVSGNPAASMVWYYTNGTLTAPTSADYSAVWTFEPADGDVIKVYVGSEAPTPCVVTYSLSALSQLPSVVYDYLTPVTLAPVQQNEATSVCSDTVLPGTHVIITPGATALQVEVDGEPLSADADGRFAFDVAADTAVSLSPAQVGISQAGADCPQCDVPVYNLQGMRVSRPLAPGIYITGGRKIMVR